MAKQNPHHRSQDDYLPSFLTVPSAAKPENPDSLRLDTPHINPIDMEPPPQHLYEETLAAMYAEAKARQQTYEETHDTTEDSYEKPATRNMDGHTIIPSGPHTGVTLDAVRSQLNGYRHQPALDADAQRILALAESLLILLDTEDLYGHRR